MTDYYFQYISSDKVFESDSDFESHYYTKDSWIEITESEYLNLSGTLMHVHKKEDGDVEVSTRGSGEEFKFETRSKTPEVWNTESLVQWLKDYKEICDDYDKFLFEKHGISKCMWFCTPVHPV